MGDKASPEGGGMNCEGCGTQDFFRVCMGCVRARHKAAMTRRCSCRKAVRREVPKKHLGREWISCERCLGTVRQTR